MTRVAEAQRQGQRQVLCEYFSTPHLARVVINVIESAKRRQTYIIVLVNLQ